MPTIHQIDKIFLQSKVYRLPLFRDETSFVYPYNEYSYWFFLHPKLQFTSPCYISLVYTYSDALLRNRGLMTVLINGHPVASRRFPSEKTGVIQWKVEIPMKFVKKGFNEIKIISRHYTTEELCADAENFANWIRFSPESVFVINRAPVKNLNLSFYPFPYFDNLEVNPVTSVWTLNKNFYKDDLATLLVLAGDWGLKNVATPLRLRVELTDKPINNNRIFFAGFKDIVAVETNKVDTGYIISKTIDKQFSKLTISGTSKQGYQKAIDALISGMTEMCDFDTMEVTNVPEKFIPELRKPYQKATFEEMGISPILIEGAFFKEASLIIHRPIMTAIGKDSYFAIHFKHSAVLKPELSVLSISINDIYVGSVQLNNENKDKGQIIVPIPLKLLGEPAWQIKFKAYHHIGSVDCGKSHKELAWTLIEDTSYIRLSKGFVKGYPYVNHFPYVRQEYSLTPKQVTIWLPEKPTEVQLTTAAIIAARAGQVNRVPLKWNVVFGDNFNKDFSQNSIILITNTEQIKKISPVAQNLYILPAGGKTIINRQLPVVEQSIAGKIILQAIASPWNEKAVLYSIIASDKDLAYFNEVLLDRKKYDQFAGNIVLIDKSQDVYSFNSFEKEVLENIEKERNRYTLVMKIIMGAIIIAILTGLFIFIRLFLKALARRRK
ncbi:MAG TPA: cellulose biosynthesis cyclic di-GMP-binding regulatory protein BcsB [bacterium]|nr:cellulose biosynthesis cyclic di-GMP-binding regulatory protein BcsB [bacterium]